MLSPNALNQPPSPQPTPPELPVRVYAEAVVRSASGDSLLDANVSIAADNVTRFYATLDRLQATAQRLRAEGFEVLDVGTQSISIAAPPEVYERSFQTTLEAVERPVIKELGQTTTATFLNAIDDKPFGEIDVSHTTWDTLLDGIALNEPIYYHQGLTSVTPPLTPGFDYLSLPDGVADGLNATLLHLQGITGNGVHVVMVDSGWYNHPFFQSRHHHAKVLLAPGSTDATRDDSGHGTGESANLFAIAPEVQLTVVKADVALAGRVRNVNSITALRTAIALQPDIISCSWGSDQRRRDLSPSNRILAAVIADAVRQGIIVVCSAGNGQFSFPAQHPDVIAAGGVYYYPSGTLKGKLEASNYASSFVSPVYPNRRVPDLCGLVGKLPYASYLLLPVPPGSEIDQRLASTPDGTEASDGWAAFSGTSAAAPQIAGICALIKQLHPQISPAQIKQLLQQTARDVIDGFSNPASSGAAARAGPDLSTGYGLADAFQAMQHVFQQLGLKPPPLPPLPVAQQLLQQAISGKLPLPLPPLPQWLQHQGRLSAQPNTPCCDLCPPTPHSPAADIIGSPQSLFFHRFPNNVQPIYSQQQGHPTMFENNPKLKHNFEKIQWDIEKILKKYGVANDVELIITESSFVHRSLKSKTILSLRDMLDKCMPVEKHTISKAHVLAAQSLLKLKIYQETAIEVLIEVISNDKKYFLHSTDPDQADQVKEMKELRELALQALGEVDQLEDNIPAATNFLNCVNNPDGTYTITRPGEFPQTYPGRCS